jgi:hypothetical protein
LRGASHHERHHGNLRLTDADRRADLSPEIELVGQQSARVRQASSFYVAQGAGFVWQVSADLVRSPADFVYLFEHVGPFRFGSVIVDAATNTTNDKGTYEDCRPDPLSD